MEEKETQLKIEYIDIAKIKPNEYNPKMLTEKEAKDLKKSITKYGIVDPLIINTNNEVIGGSFRLQFLREKGVKEVVPNKFKNQIKICCICQKKFIAKKDYKSRKQIYCSLKCFGLSRAKFKKCLSCGREFYNYQNKYFCSMKCAGEYKRGKKFSFKHRQKISENRKGIIPSWQLNKEKKNEIYKKISKALSGKPQPWNQKENHHNWQGGITELNLQIRGALKYKHWRKAIFERDNYTCQFCNGRGIKIIADHKKKFAQILFENNIKTLKDALKCEELWNLDNGQTLCRECHRKTETFGGGKFYGGKIKMAY